MTPFVAWLESALEARGWRATDLARELGVSDTTVSRWRRGGGIEFSSVRQIALLFGVPVEDLARLSGLHVSDTDVQVSDSLADVLSPEEMAERAEFQAFWERVRQTVPRPFWKSYRDAADKLREGFSAIPPAGGRLTPHRMSTNIPAAKYRRGRGQAPGGDITVRKYALTMH